jgi:hypothetical protein
MNGIIICHLGANAIARGHPTTESSGSACGLLGLGEQAELTKAATYESLRRELARDQRMGFAFYGVSVVLDLRSERSGAVDGTADLKQQLPAGGIANFVFGDGRSPEG